MESLEVEKTCRNCGAIGSRIYCSVCGNHYTFKRITIASILHDIFHFFTHLDKGFGFTLKQLFVTPGTMQREYIQGFRSRHQKPFSMFFICASVTALLRYWINLALISYYNSGNPPEGDFFHQYMVLMHSLLLPFYALMTYLLFYKSKYNYAEIVVFTLYTVSVFFLLTIIVSLLHFIWPGLDTDYIELALLTTYNAITSLNFFRNDNKWIVLAKSIINIAVLFLVANYAQDLVTDFLRHK